MANSLQQKGSVREMQHRLHWGAVQSVAFFYLVYLSPVAASVSEAGSATSRLAEHNIARTTEDDCLCVAEYSSDLKATWALDIHEETVRTLY
mmetsp:Transcript_575/g.707  ORF Transcript_575/g.707 Transcript_575/m.707 type:complete len:92 (-) Transcript_575:171-446(-)